MKNAAKHVKLNNVETLEERIAPLAAVSWIKMYAAGEGQPGGGVLVPPLQNNFPPDNPPVQLPPSQDLIGTLTGIKPIL